MKDANVDAVLEGELAAKVSLKKANRRKMQADGVVVSRSQASKEKFSAVLAGVPDVEARAEDVWPPLR